MQNIKGATLPYLRSFHPAGLVGALLFFTWSLTPSLLPRMWYFQALATAISMAIGYGLGVLVAKILRWSGVKVMPSPQVRKIGWWTLAVATIVLIPLFGILGAQWQRETRELVGVETEARSFYILVVIIAFALAALFIQLGRGIGALTAKIINWGAKHVPRPVSRLTTVAVLVIVVTLFADGVLPNLIVRAMESSQVAVNSKTREGIVQPAGEPLRSGSDESLQSWDSLGRDGRSFVASGPRAQDITAVTGQEAIEPIRVYAGRQSADTLEEIADNVVAEMHRTGAFERGTIAVVTTTGRGWVNPAGADSLEYITAGNSAIASMQYSYLQSPLAFMADRETPLEAGIVLLDKVQEAMTTIPEADRPRLVVMGESLGGYGAQGAVGSKMNLIETLDGALIIGNPHFSQPWQRLTEQRDAGSPERLPVIDGGENIRFAARGEDLSLLDDWATPRFVYWQHASDPIVWWSFDLILHRPDWLKEELGPDVNTNMRWMPFVTFWQVTADMALSTGVPDGYGHAYGADAVDMWAGILDEPGWSLELSDRVRAVLQDPDPTLEPLGTYY
ncbi:alpha/beta hydrolase [Corynebacterium sp. S7]